MKSVDRSVKTHQKSFCMVMRYRKSHFSATHAWALGLAMVLAGACTKKADDKASLPEPKSPTVAVVEEKKQELSVPEKIDATPPNSNSEPSVVSSEDSAESKNGGDQIDAKMTVTRSALDATPAVVDGDGTYRLVGEIVAQRRSQIAFRVGGFIEEIEVKPGLLVKKGGTLARLESRDFKLRHDMAKMKKEGARIALESASREFKRENALKQENASTESNFDKVKNAFDQSQLALQMAEIELKNAENALNDVRLVAPYDCVVASQLKYEGESVQSGTAVFEIYDTASPELTLRAPEKLLGQMAVGESITVKVPSAGLSGTAKIIRIVPVVNEKTRTFNVTAQFDSVTDKLVPGLFAEGIVHKQSRTKI